MMHIAISNLDDFVKSPDAALRFILPLLSQGQAYCGVFGDTFRSLWASGTSPLPDASFLRVRAPCLRSFLRSRPTFKAFATYYESVNLELLGRAEMTSEPIKFPHFS